MKEFKDRVAVITGGANGIGLAMTKSFGAEGMKLVIADIERDVLNRSVEALRSRDFEATGIQCDVANYADGNGWRSAPLRHTARSTCSATMPAYR